MRKNTDYIWKLSDLDSSKEKRGTVFSCFSCGGGSTMGYKLAGFDVIGINEIDQKCVDTYQLNFDPKFVYCESIVDMAQRDEFPDELYHLDILDGSPPCSSFSAVGNREKDWGKKKKFAEGQKEQVLDTLFFDFIELGRKLQPKVIVAENVTGLLFKTSKHYVDKIFSDFDKAGYYVNMFVVNAADVGVPQIRKRLFFIAGRKDLIDKAGLSIRKNIYEYDMNIEFSVKSPARNIPYSEVRDIDKNNHVLLKKDSVIRSLWDITALGDNFSKVHPTGSFFNCYRLSPDKICPTLTTRAACNIFDYEKPRAISPREVSLIGSFPSDYNFGKMSPYFIVPMSVPPLLSKYIANCVYDQILSKF